MRAKRQVPALCLIIAALVGGCARVRFERGLDPESREFFTKTQLIITSEERRAFMALAPEQRKDFIQDFWARRDPTPGTPANEYKDTYFRYIEEANKLFRDGPGPGWLQDRGRVYVMLGPPDNRETYPRGVTFYGLPTEIWWYGFFPIVFIDDRWTGDYKLDPLSAGQITEINRAETQWNQPWQKKPGASKAVAPDLDIKIRKKDEGGATLSVVLPYRSIWLKAEGDHFKATLELSIEVLDAAGTEVWTYSEKYPIDIREKNLKEILITDYEITVDMPLGPGAYTMNLGLTNSNDESQAKVQKKFEI